MWTSKTMTERREAWLRHLLNGPSVRTGWGNAPCHCMRNGWTKWVDLFNDEQWPWSEEITLEGIEALRLYGRAHPSISH